MIINRLGTLILRPFGIRYCESMTVNPKVEGAGHILTIVDICTYKESQRFFEIQGFEIPCIDISRGNLLQVLYCETDTFKMHWLTSEQLAHCRRIEILSIFLLPYASGCFEIESISTVLYYRICNVKPSLLPQNQKRSLLLGMQSGRKFREALDIDNQSHSLAFGDLLSGLRYSINSSLFFPCTF